MTSIRHIVHFDLDSFYVSVERLFDPTLIGIPLIVGGHGDRSVVSSCSYEARKFGVRSAMSVIKAKQLCPQAAVVSPNMSRYAAMSNAVTEIMGNNVPVLEKASIDEFYVDLSGMDRFFDPYEHACKLRQTIINETKLPISFGFATNKTVAKIATGKAKPNGQFRVEAGKEKEFMASLNVGEIPMVGEKTQELLMKMGIHKVSQLQTTPINQLEQVLGKMGRLLWEKANGIDNNPVEPFQDRKSISTETTFDTDTTDREYLGTLLVAMSNELGHKIRREGKYAACIAIKLRFNNFETFSKQLTIAATQSDAAILEAARLLFSQLYTTNTPIRLIGLRLTNLGTEKGQAGLFDSGEQKDKLYTALDNIKAKFGTSSVRAAITLKVKKEIGNRKSQ